MADFPGLTFSPTSDQTKNPDGSPSNGGLSNGPQSYAPIQDAIRTLRFNIPRFGGATSPIPQSLLMGAGSGGLDLQGILAALFGNQPQRGMPGGGAGPMPNVYPGSGQPPLPGGGSPPSDPSLPRPGQSVPTPPYQQPRPPGGYGPLVTDPPATPPSPMGPGGPLTPPLGGMGGGRFGNRS